jgi:hypothetical protein
VVRAHHERQVRRDQPGHRDRDDQDVQQVQAVVERAAARVLAVPDRRADVAADQRHRQGDAVGDGQAHPRQQVVGQRVAGEALEDRQAEQRHADHPRQPPRVTERAGEEHAQQVQRDRGDEHQRGPVVGLAHQQAAGHVEAQPQRRVIGLGHLAAGQRRVRPAVDDARRLVGVEEAGQEDAGRDQRDEAVEGDLPEQERPVLGEDVAQGLAQHAAGAEALVDEADGVVALHVRSTLHHDGPTEPLKPPPARRSPRSSA